MPGNIAAAAPSGVFPQTLSTLFTETFALPMLMQPYHDTTLERSIIQDGVNEPVTLRTWKLSKRLKASDFTALKNFYEGQDGGLTPFYFYDPFAADPPGANYDPTGAESVGRLACVFRGNWSESINIARSETALEIAQIA